MHGQMSWMHILCIKQEYATIKSEIGYKSTTILANMLEKEYFCGIFLI